MERVTKASFVLFLVFTALLAGAEGGRDVPKTNDEVYNPQHFLGLGLGWPLLGHWLFGWGPWGLWPFLGNSKAVGLKDKDVNTKPGHGGATKGYAGAGSGAAFP